MTSFPPKIGGLGGQNQVNFVSPKTIALLLPTPDSLFPTPSTKKNSVKSWLIPMLDRMIFCNSQEPYDP
ncbi:hypothetical protein BJP36_43040 [Moorena producens JHB]|uniref:Uncharacterized protein n=1 Tax=Moorena producens (strain JHB) TaxID=1454205 RepID=A0A9Q9UVT2_MOOP1|nr:hypothetical protein [Moorena producens]NEQ14826.1 hypothetical protein [Moorena sp. SIO3E2]WAN69136.1 hypothetical protein BJP36_43040 [Moorena producens JHB]